MGHPPKFIEATSLHQKNLNQTKKQRTNEERKRNYLFTPLALFPALSRRRATTMFGNFPCKLSEALSKMMQNNQQKACFFMQFQKTGNY
jgi:hypothetical protein